MFPLPHLETSKSSHVLVAPPQQSKEEIRALEAESAFTVQAAITTAVLLYLCTSK